LAQAIESSDFPEGYIRSASFFFKELQRLEADLLLGELEVVHALSR